MHTGEIMNNYNLLISRLDAFIRKYYTNKLIRGIIVFMTCLLLFILTVSISEYFLYMPPWLRITIATIFIAGSISALVVWIIIPLAKMSRLGKIISHEQAAAIIGQHFHDVDDKLLNILQLRKQHDSYSSKELIEASIDQKAKQIAPIPILSAIDYGKNRRYLPYFLPVLLVGVILLVAAPNIFTDASTRLLQPTKTFEKPAPFRFIIKDERLRATRNSDYTVTVTTEGEVLPADMFMSLGKDLIPMIANDDNEFTYVFRNVTESTDFKLYAGGFYSKEYNLEVVQKPVLKAFRINLDYPAYTGKKDEAINSLSDMTLPAGTIVGWTFTAEHTDKASLQLGDGEENVLENEKNTFGAHYRFMNDTSYTLILRNDRTKITDRLSYQVKVIPDEHPVLQVEEFRDSVSGKQVLVQGTAGDDYGINKVLFHYKIMDKGNNVVLAKTLRLPATQGAVTPFQYYFDINKFKLTPGQQVAYYVEAWDNDGVNGSKASRSEVMTYKMFDENQLDSAMNANSEQINSGLSNTSQKAEQLQEQFRDMQNKLMQSDDMNWEQQQSFQNMMKMQEALQNEMKSVKKRFEEQLQQSEQKEYSEDLKQKQQDLKEQMDNVLNKELQEQMDKLRELMAKLNKQEAMKAMQEMEQQNKLFNMDMERMKELMKKLEMQMRMEDLANKMGDLAEKQLALKEKTDKKSESNESLSKKQEELNKELNEALSKDMDEMKKLNEEMKKNQELNNEEELAKEAGEEMQESKEQLNKNNNSKSSQSQQKAAENLKSMSQSLAAAASGMDIQQIQKDIRAVRQILSNLMRLSFDQEQLMEEIKDVNLASQSYVAKQREQKRLHDNSKMIRDSLFELSKDNFKLNATVNKETTELEKNMRSSVSHIEDRKIGDAMTKQQYVMTHTNNLALMLNEMLSNLLSMQSQAQQGKQGQCNNPGGKTPKPGSVGKQLSDVITKQQGLGDAMQQMQDAMSKRKGNSSEGKDGKQNENAKNKRNQQGGEYGDAEQLARMAQQQAALRKQLQELSSLLNSNGLSGSAKELKEIQEQMDKNETQLVNRRLNSQLLMRQQEILTRLLEAEKSVRQQMQDDKRSSKTAQEMNRNIPPELRERMKQQGDLTEQYKTTPAVLKPYYKQMVNDYYKLLGI